MRQVVFELTGDTAVALGHPVLLSRNNARPVSAAHLRQAIAFLYVCENEGVNIQELAFVARLSKQTASRAAKMMAAGDSEHQAPPLLRLEKHPSDGRLVRIFLDDGGRILRDKINAAIVERRLVDVNTAAPLRVASA